ncbi:MAG: YegS/Rv2252/BmrU family lipid kinase [Paludibacteraceae bacterium]|nr:YegS/Rv2252/BmrU family lipid kinase [Paludibacteraceae bacterium]
MKNIAFIINPIAGSINKHKLPRQIEKELDHTHWLENIVFTEYAGHATLLAGQYAKMGFDAVVAVGGDGTVNEVLQGVRDTETALGVIPTGSGNGFARHIGMSMRISKAIEQINRGEAVKADYGLVNDRPFLCTCGIGFDALIANHFAGSNSRGMKTYMRNILRDLFSYQPETYIIRGKDIELNPQAFLVTFANSNQWGNDAFIAPQASIQDGKMDIAILSKFPLILAPSLAFKLFTKNIEHDMFMNTVQTAEVTVTREKEGPLHIDGEPMMMPRDLHIRIIEDGLRILVEKHL